MRRTDRTAHDLSFKARILNKGRRKYKLNSQRKHLSILVFLILFYITFHPAQCLAQNISSTDSESKGSSTSDTTRKLLNGKITNFGYGGPAIKFSSFNNQFAFMTGGRGAITINKQYTIGGGGYGIANSINIPGSSEDTSRLFKMGYGGIELGYIFLSGKKVNIGTSLLFAGGAAFWQNKPKSNNEKLVDNDFSIFPLLEPSLYSEVALNRFMWLHAGISYRYVHRAHLDYMTDHRIRGFSCYIGLLFGK